ncbi:hypothetical protein ACFSSA_01480 [Luteolibacter algae]|uniref:CvpA family protein n=1 Tax=Luteolibacter algae TaxID=454151 RepID=A0ABW5D3R0_9BACT
METLPEISLGTAALIVFAVCAGYMFLRGLARTFVNSAFLVASAWAGFEVWQKAPALAIEWTGKTSPVITTGLPILAFLVTLVVLRKIIGFFRAPLPKAAEDVAPRSIGQLVFRLMVTLLPAALLCLMAATILHHFSSIADIKESTQKTGESWGLGGRLKNSIAVAIPPEVMGYLDPLTSDPRVKLAKIIAANPENPLAPVLDPDTGRPYPRAIIVDEPELRNLAREKRFSTLLRHPLLTDALKDPEVRYALGLR